MSDSEKEDRQLYGHLLQQRFQDLRALPANVGRHAGDGHEEGCTQLPVLLQGQNKSGSWSVSYWFTPTAVRSENKGRKNKRVAEQVDVQSAEMTVFPTV